MREPDRKDDRAQRVESSLIRESWISTCREILLQQVRSRLGTLHGKAAASDIVGEAFVRAIERQHQFQGNTRGQFIAWVRKILQRCQIDFFRRYGAESRDVTREFSLDGPTSNECDGHVHLMSTYSTPSSIATTTENKRLLATALSRLSGDHRLVITYRDLNGLDWSDIGEKMNRSPEAARLLWIRALKALQCELPSDLL